MSDAGWFGDRHPRWAALAPTLGMALLVAVLAVGLLLFTWLLQRGNPAVINPSSMFSAAVSGQRAAPMTVSYRAGGVHGGLQGPA